MKKIMVMVGTRPEAIKLAPVIQALRTRADDFQVCVCLSSQHREMLVQALRWFPVSIDEDLNIMRHGQHLTDTLSAILTAVRDVIERNKPDWLVVQGDTTTTLAGALAGFYAGVNVAHVEAGLRSDNRLSPFPEEMNRTLISRLASLHFAPTRQNADRLRAEKTEGAIHVVGNTVVDALLQMQQIIAGDDQQAGSAIVKSLAAVGYNADTKREFVLVTGHRRENFGEGLQNICQALLQIADAHPQTDIIYAAHLNPHVQEPVNKMLAGRDNIHILPPLDYATFVWLMNRCLFVMTDSGGIQEEAPSLNKPVLVMRRDTERPEVLACGAAKLTGTATADIVAAANQLMTDQDIHRQMASAENPYGDGQSAIKIAEILAQT